MTSPDPRRVADAALAVACVTLLFAAGALVWAWVELRNDQWKPLGPFPTQAVDLPSTYAWEAAGSSNTQEIPAAALTDGVFVPVSGAKCYKEAVTVTGVVAWTVLDPPGRVFETGRGTAVKEPGCVTSNFENVIPDDLAELAAVHGHPVVVAITGCETPTDPDRGEGATLCWSTEPFALVP